MPSKTRAMKTLSDILKWALLASSPVVLLNGQFLPGSSSIGIAITAPANGITVSGNVVVSAHAIADLGVASVQFFIDGVPIAAAVSTPPYSMNWNTTSTANGAHSLSAVVIDTGGHQTSASIGVSVSNAAPPVVSITVGPASATLTASQSQQFTAMVAGSSNMSVSWSINPAVGTISNGLYTAPSTIASAQNIVVTATSQADPSKTATATISLTVAPPPVTITLGPANISLTAFQTKQFTATVTGSSNTAVSWSLTPPVGGISNGLYTAPSVIATAQNVTVTATSLADPTKSAIALIGLTVPPPPISISLGPANTNLTVSQTQQFTATITGSSNMGVSWTLTPPVGTITNGLYTAPATIAVAQNVTVTATSVADSTKSATAVISLTPPVSMTLGPATTSLSVSQTQQFTATITGSSNMGVSWTLTPPVGTITNGLYTAPATIAVAQNVIVTATSVADSTKSATALIGLTPPISITLGPTNASLTASQTQQFTATVIGSSSTGVSWMLTPAVGTIANGLYTAPAMIAAAQNVTVTATSLADSTKSSTATISLTPAVSISLGPANTSLAATQTQQFTATVTGSSNTGVSYTLNPSLGTVSSSGLYTAPATINTAQNVMLTATSLADTAKSALAVIALTMSPGATPLGISISAPANASKISGNIALSATASANTASVQFYADGTPVGSQIATAPYTVNWNSQSVPDGTHTLSAVAQDTAGNRVTATISVTVNNVPVVSRVSLPVEVVGPDGFTQTIQVNVASVPSGTIRLWLQIHGLRYQTQASVQVNNSGWIPINEITATLLGQASAFGGIGGGFHTLTMTLNLPPGAITTGTNAVSFRFNGTDGNVSGFRVLGLNFQGPDGNGFLPAGTFLDEDPNTWQAPSTQSSDIAAGKNLWYGANLTVPTSSGPAPIRAHCTSCHAQDGRDLKYFNYSNNSIRTRSIFHGLTAQQGDQIASYIRSLNTPNPGRVWNPPYQPGPGLDSQPVEQWSAGAGLGAVLNSDQEVLNGLFPNGIQPATFSATGNLNVRETKIALQLADWNSWLPTIHPLDAWGDEFTNSKYYQDYLSIRSWLRYGDPVAYANGHAYFAVWPGDYGQFLSPKAANSGPTPDPSYWTPVYINELYSTALWNMVKNWELNQEFGLEGMAKTVFTSPLADSRAWDSEFAFFTSPNMLHIPPGFPGLHNGKATTFTYLSFMWYHTQLILNNSNHQQMGSAPIDWPYVYSFIYDLANEDSPGQTGMLYLWSIKALQISNNGLAPGQAGWIWNLNDPMIQVVQGPAANSLWSGTSPMARAALYEGSVRAFLDVVEKFTPQQFYQVGAADPAVAPVRGQEFGTFGDRVWFAIPLFHYYGVSQSLINEFASWAQTMWPAVDWSVTTRDTCYQGNSGIICYTEL
jgi:hypothetical protein